MHRFGAESSSFRVTVVAIAQPSSDMRLSAPARLSNNKNRLPGFATAQLGVMGVAQPSRLHWSAAMTERFWKWRFPLPPRAAAMRLAQVLTLAVPQLKVRRSVVLFVAVFVMNNFAPSERTANHVGHHDAVFQCVRPVAGGQRMADADANQDVATLINNPSALPLPCSLATSERTNRPTLPPFYSAGDSAEPRFVGREFWQERFAAVFADARRSRQVRPGHISRTISRGILWRRS
jgi:hypothetical protein